ncbi:MAG: flavodoxin family protein [Lachnospiraceae bacterium]|nr:flavodoxin family protein [Lachnospiraceae bacterium]
MSKKVLAIVSSPRAGGNSEMLVNRFLKGAEEAGHETEKLCLRDKNIHPCMACETCVNNGGGICAQDDDMDEILQKLIAADVLVLSSPVYFYSISAQLKMMIDRTMAVAGRIKNKEVYFIATASAGEHAMETTMNDMEGFVRNLPDSEVKGKIYGSAHSVGDIAGEPAMDEAYTYGLNC